MVSEGYLINQSLAGRTNQRDNEYGGTCNNRMMIATKIIRDTRNGVGKYFILMFRVSMINLTPEFLSWDNITELAMALEDAGGNIITTSVVWHESQVPTISKLLPRPAFTFPTHRIKLSYLVLVPLFVTNCINYPDVVERVMDRSDTNLISMYRTLLADPDITRKGN